MLAVIKTGGKQYIVKPDDEIEIEKIKGKKQGDKVVFGEVLLLEKRNKVQLGNPFIEKATVVGEIIEEGKSKKTIIFKYKAKTRYKVKKGHRQPFMKVKIKKIED